MCDYGQTSLTLQVFFSIDNMKCFAWRGPLELLWEYFFKYIIFFHSRIAESESLGVRSQAFGSRHTQNSLSVLKREKKSSLLWRHRETLCHIYSELTQLFISNFFVNINCVWQGHTLFNTKLNRSSEYGLRDVGYGWREAGVFRVTVTRCEPKRGSLWDHSDSLRPQNNDLETWLFLFCLHSVIIYFLISLYYLGKILEKCTLFTSAPLRGITRGKYANLSWF